MRIGFVSQPWEKLHPPHDGSSLAIWTHQVARRLAPSCQVAAYARKAKGQRTLDLHEGVQYRRLLTDADELLQRVLARLGRMLRSSGPNFDSWLYYPFYTNKAARELRLQQADVIHIVNFSSFVPRIRALNPRAKIVLHMQCEWLTQLPARIIAQRLAKVDRIIGCSNFIADKVRRRFPQFASRCRTVYNGVDVDRFAGAAQKAPRGAGKRLLYVGRVSPEKGVHVLLEAFGKVLRRVPQAELRIVGGQVFAPKEFIVDLSDDPKVSQLAPLYHDGYLSQLRKTIPGKAAASVSFLGSVSHLQALRHYLDADVAVAPSICEAFGMPLAEAMAAGLPVVATRTGGIPEVVEDGKTGTLVEPGNAEALAQAIINMLEDDRARKDMGEAGRKRALEMFSWDRIVEALLKEYRDLCQEAAPSPRRAAGSGSCKAHRGSALVKRDLK